MNHKFSLVFLLSSVLLTSGLFSGCAPPTAKLKVSRSEIKAGEPVTVSWETKNAKNIELNGQSVEKIGAKTFTPNDTTSYTILARKGKKSAKDTASVKVEIIKPAAPTVSISSTPDAIERGNNTRLKWVSENAKVITISGLGEVPGSGDREVSPRVSTTYTINASGDGGNASASTRVTVTEPPPPPAPPPPAPVKEPEPPIADQFRSIARSVFFDLDKSDLLAPEQDKLRRLADWLNQERNRTIAFRIEGNCDPRGTAEYNLGLGDRRARSVKDFLVSLGVDPSRIETISYGLENAKGTDEGSSDAPPSWAYDRRGDFVYLRGGDRP
ncbi:MAG TPA: OmpA family protein [Blastocatellia bacterium]|nr:OmpA family protein [Blastocatellia bacterium]